MHGKQQNLNLTSIFILKFISTISFGIFFSSLSLLLIHTFKLSTSATTSLVALFLGFHYSLPLLGGKIGDYFKDYKMLLIRGKIFQLMSALILIYAIEHPKFIYLGLGCFLVDSMFNAVTQNMLLTRCFEQSQKQERQSAFLKGYLWMNLGFMGAFFISGIVYRFIGIDSLLHISALATLATIIYAYFYIRDYEHKNSQKTTYILISSMMSIAFGMSILLSNTHLTREVILLVAVLFIAYLLIKTLFGRYNKNSINYLKFFFYMGLSVLFWTMYMLGPTFITLFIDQVVDTVIFGFNVPTQWFQVIDGVIIITVGALLARYTGKNGCELNRRLLYVIGVSCAIFALLILSLCLDVYSPGTKVSFWWVLSTLMMLCIGEVFVAPASSALVGDYISEKEQGAYMGISKMTTGIAVVLSGLLSEKWLIPAFNMNRKVMISSHSQTFALFLSIVVIILGYFLFERLLSNKVNTAKVTA